VPTAPTAALGADNLGAAQGHGEGGGQHEAEGGQAGEEAPQVGDGAADHLPPPQGQVCPAGRWQGVQPTPQVRTTEMGLRQGAMVLLR